MLPLYKNCRFWHFLPKTKAGKTEIEDYYAEDVQKKYQVTPVQFIDLKVFLNSSCLHNIYAYSV